MTWEDEKKNGLNIFSLPSEPQLLLVHHRIRWREKEKGLASYGVFEQSLWQLGWEETDKWKIWVILVWRWEALTYWGTWFFCYQRPGWEKGITFRMIFPTELAIKKGVIWKLSEFLDFVSTTSEETMERLKQHRQTGLGSTSALAQPWGFVVLGLIPYFCSLLISWHLSQSVMVLVVYITVGKRKETSWGQRPFLSLNLWFCKYLLSTKCQIELSL